MNSIDMIVGRLLLMGNGSLENNDFAVTEITMKGHHMVLQHESSSNKPPHIAKSSCIQNLIIIIYQ